MLLPEMYRINGAKNQLHHCVHFRFPIGDQLLDCLFLCEMECEMELFVLLLILICIESH